MFRLVEPSSGNTFYKMCSKGQLKEYLHSTTSRRISDYSNLTYSCSEYHGSLFELCSESGIKCQDCKLRFCLWSALYMNGRSAIF
jgi:hypothetical protein